MLSVAIITFNEEQNIGRTMASVEAIAGEFIIVDSGSTDRTLEIARGFNRDGDDRVKIFFEPWKGFTKQKNSSIEKCTGAWVLSIDADEEVSPELRDEIARLIAPRPHESQSSDVGPAATGRSASEAGVGAGVSVGTGVSPVQASSASRPGIVASVPRKNLFLERWIKHGGGWPDRKYRLFERGAAKFGERAVHEDIKVDPNDPAVRGIDLQGPLIHHAYPTLDLYIEHMNRYSSLGADVLVAKRARGFSIFSIVVQPAVRFFYNYFVRGGFLDGREGLLFHLYHSVYMSWKYAKAWERSRQF